MSPEKLIPQYDGNETLNLSTEYQEHFSIPVLVTSNRSNIKSNQLGTNRNNLITIRRNNKLLEAANLLTVVTLNPRSLYNKQSCFRTMIEQTEADVCFVSETWDRSHTENGNLITDLLDLEGYS